jgi:hypothetical protein
MAGKETLREKLEQLKEKSEEALSQLSEEIRTSPGFVKAVEGARRGQEIVEASLRKAKKRIDAPSREEYTALVSRVDALEKRITGLARAARGETVARKKTAKSSPKKAARRS